ncbi:type II secretion system protein [Candidatus Gottesmanbacteria bacterium]|nr:type II secretion system protein [Candidatus Gottesmanbacteria bacterium]
MKVTTLKSKKGFTLLEILVVVGILSVIAIGLLAALDPLEQLRKGRDSNKRNLATAYYNAIVRYQAAYGSYPYGNLAVASSTMNIATVTAITGELVAKSELKQGLATNSNDWATLVFSATAFARNDPTVCFIPESRSVELDSSQARFIDGTAGTGAGCPTNVANNCYVCIF